MNAAKQTHLLIPHCHQIPLDTVSLVFEVADDWVEVRCLVKAQARTGVEMEALVGVSAALNTSGYSGKRRDDLMNTLRFCLVLGPIFLLLASPVRGETVYVTDTFKITLRTGPSTDNKILLMLSPGRHRRKPCASKTSPCVSVWACWSGITRRAQRKRSGLPPRSGTIPIGSIACGGNMRA